MMRRLLEWLARLTLARCVANFFVTYAMFATVKLPWTSNWLRRPDEPPRNQSATLQETYPRSLTRSHAADDGATPSHFEYEGQANGPADR